MLLNRRASGNVPLTTTRNAWSFGVMP